MFHKIIVPLDGSRLAEQAIEPALALAKEVNGEIVLVQAPISESVVYESQMAYSGVWVDPSPEDAYREAREYLADMQEKIKHPNVIVRRLVLEGDVAGSIVDVAAEEKADLIVMSTHGRSGLDRLLLGSVTERVLRHAPCPVLALRYAHPIERVLVTLDGSEFAEIALQPAITIAKVLGAKLYLLRVDDSPAYVSQFEVDEMDRVEPGLGQQVQAGFEHEAEDYLRSVQVRLDKEIREGLSVKTAVLHGNAPTQICQLAEDNAIDLIVMATHGRRGFTRWVYGSVTEKVLRTANRNMLVVR